MRPCIHGFLVLLVVLAAACGGDKDPAKNNTNKNTANANNGRTPATPTRVSPSFNYDGSLPVAAFEGKAKEIAARFNALVAESGPIPKTRAELRSPELRARVLADPARFRDWSASFLALRKEAQGTKVFPWIEKPCQLFGRALGEVQAAIWKDIKDVARAKIEAGDWQAGLASIGWTDDLRRLVPEENAANWETKFPEVQKDLIPKAYKVAVVTAVLEALDRGDFDAAATRQGTPDALRAAAEACDAADTLADQESRLRGTLVGAIRKRIESSYQPFSSALTGDLTPERIAELRTEITAWEAEQLAKGYGNRFGVDWDASIKSMAANIVTALKAREKKP